jgi:hypothetical protein
MKVTKLFVSLSFRTKLKNEGIDDASQSKTERSLQGSIGHLSESEIQFFDKWLKIINLEADEDELSLDSKNLWIKSIAERYTFEIVILEDTVQQQNVILFLLCLLFCREKEGKCIGELTLAIQNQDKFSSATFATFAIPEVKRKEVNAVCEKDFIILGNVREPCVSFGYVESIQDGLITVSLDR